MDQSPVWDIAKKESETLVTLTGDIDETSDFGPLEALTGQVTLDLAGISGVNSEGARRWINLMRSLEKTVDGLVFVRCSIPIVIQMNMIYGFRGTADVRSFYAPYLCDRTGQEDMRLLTREMLPEPLEPPTFPCEGGKLELDDIPERYFAFLLDDTNL